MKKKKTIILIIVLLISITIGAVVLFSKENTIIAQFKGASINFNAGTTKELILDTNGGEEENETFYLTSEGELYTGSSRNPVSQVNVPTRRGYSFKGYFYSNNNIALIDNEGSINKDAMKRYVSYRRC